MRTQREERETSELRRRLEERNRQAKEESARIEQVLHQAEKRLNEYWERQVKDKEVRMLYIYMDGYMDRLLSSIKSAWACFVTKVENICSVVIGIML